ncbi:MAG TPA: 4-hydroxybenzoate octaprenyltransferase [Geobacteraceae bacterium]|nr:4-hydroxybenzoate octaprenyltransferase [Geobacteraceae bacterium]
MGSVVYCPPGIFRTLRMFLEMIKFSHTIFALPFAFTGAVLAASGLPSRYQLFWILMAMVGARTAAMGFNRLIDAEIDRANPRTSGRAIPAGLLGKKSVAVCSGAAVMLFFLAAYRLNHLCFMLSPVALFFLVFYSFCKRFTTLSHLVLGICLGAAPMGAWIAVRGSLAPAPIILGLAVLFWVAGFDVLYALQDLEFDRSTGLRSIPARLGTRGALLAARLFHSVTLGLLFSLPAVTGLGGFYCAGVVVAAVLLAYEHWLVRDGDLDKLDAAFFTMNGYISITVFFFTLADVLFS